MLNQRLWQITISTKVRLLQLLLLIVAVWFFFWAHIFDMVIWNKTFAESLQSGLANILIYLSALIAIFLAEVYLKRAHTVSTKPYLTETPKSLHTSKHTSKEQLKHGAMKPTKTPSNKIAISFLVVGVVLLIISYVFASVIVAFIGLSLTFWGALFLFVRSTKFVRSSILAATILPSYLTLDRILADLKYDGKALYIPPYPRDAYLPEHLRGMKEQIVFIAAKDSKTVPSIDEMAKKQFIVKNPKGIFIFPPGSGLLSVFEKELKIDLTKIDREAFYESLSVVILNNLELATAFEIKPEDELIHVAITNSVYNNLYSRENKLKSVQLVGCPLVSAVACALAITTGKPVTIAKSRVSLDLKTIETWYQLVEG
jgi:hypothetical protein